MDEHVNNGRNRVLYVELGPGEHTTLKMEAAMTGSTIGYIVKTRLIAPLQKEHEVLFGRGGKCR